MCVLTPEEVDEVEAAKRALLPGELESILTHKYYMSERAGRDVGLDYAVMDWKKHQAVNWRAMRMREDVEIQFDEMMKYKWVESKKAGSDLGKDALMDWICKYAKGWRKCRERNR